MYQRQGKDSASMTGIAAQPAQFRVGGPKCLVLRLSIFWSIDLPARTIVGLVMVNDRGGYLVSPAGGW